MSIEFGSFCDEFYVSCRLFLKLDLTLERETVLHFLDQIRKEFPNMRRFRTREDGALLLEENPTEGSSRRWIRLEPAGLRFGFFDPPEIGQVRRLADVILELAPYQLTLSEIDFDHFEVIYGFDLLFRGNHDLLVAETLWNDHPMAGFLLGDAAAHVIDAQPYVGIGLTPDCDLQAYVETKSRTSTYEVRTEDYERSPLSVFLTVRKYWRVGEEPPLKQVAATMFDRADELASNKVVPLVVNPLAHAIASRL